MTRHRVSAVFYTENPLAVADALLEVMARDDIYMGEVTAPTEAEIEAVRGAEKRPA